MARNDHERLNEVEGQLTHLQKYYEELNNVVVEQSKQILRLERAVLALENQTKDLMRQSREPRDPLAERPPHY